MEEFETESNAKKYAIIGVSVGLALLLVGVGIFVIVKRRAALDGEVPSGGNPPVAVNGAGGATPGAPKGETGQPEAPLWEGSAPIPNELGEGAPADATSVPPTAIDPRTNRLLTDKEKEDAGYPKDWVVRVQAFKSPSGTVFLKYTVEKKPSDQDNDGLSDQEEREAGSDPTKADTDGDGLSDRQEVVDYKTDPTKADTDGDGANDANEVSGKTDPLSKISN
jgi:Bacterial TSP3 repeat